MRQIGGAVILLVLACLALPAATVAFSPTPVEDLRIDWEQIARGERAIIRGYVYNQHQMRAENVRVRVEQLDAAARPVLVRTTYVIGTIPYRDRGYFELAVPVAGATYRLSIESFDRAGCGSG